MGFTAQVGLESKEIHENTEELLVILRIIASQNRAGEFADISGTAPNIAEFSKTFLLYVPA